jgi:hypothetical protein
MKRWVGLGVIADNLINIGRAIPKRGRLVARPPTAAIVNPPAVPGGFAVPAAMWHRHENREFCAGK